MTGMVRFLVCAGLGAERPGDGVSVLGCALLTMVGATGGLPLVMAGIAVLALGTGPLFALGTGLVVGSAPPERAGSAASMSETSNYLGGALGMALIGAIGASVYRGHMAHTVAAGVPTSAGETLAGAASASHHLPPAQAAELIRTANDAFTSGLDVTGVIAAVIFGGLAVLIATMLRFLGGVAERLPFNDGAFDLVISTTSFDHWTGQQERLTECARVLVPAIPATLSRPGTARVGVVIARRVGWWRGRGLSRERMPW
jgi:Methyltransferase domain